MTDVTIAEDRLARFLSPDISLVAGAGKGANGTVDVCIMQAVDWLVGGNGKTDAPSCVDPGIRRFCIRLNDSSTFAAFRDELKPFAPRVANTRGDDALMRKRAFMSADWAVRTVAPMAIDQFGKKPELAARLRALPAIVDRETSIAARDVTREATKELRDAYADAYAAAYAAAAAADAAAYVDAAAADAAAAAAAAAADAAADVDVARSKAAAFSRTMWDESLRFLGALIEARV